MVVACHLPYEHWCVPLSRRDEGSHMSYRDRVSSPGPRGCSPWTAVAFGV